MARMLSLRYGFYGRTPEAHATAGPFPSPAYDANSPGTALTPHQSRVLPLPHLYHYTTPAGLIGILQSRVLHGTEVRFVNDTSEGRHVLEVAKGYLTSLLDNELDQHRRSAIDHVMRALNLEGNPTFIASLTEMPDDLAQWRGYAGGGGYAIALPAVLLRRAAAKEGYSLLRCIYTEAEQRSLIKPEMDAAVAELAHEYALGLHPKRPDSAEPPSKGRLSFHLPATLSQIGALIKNPAFEKEAEWRLIRHIRGGSSDVADFDVRPGTWSCVPYYPFRFAAAASYAGEPSDEMFGRTYSEQTFARAGPTVDVGAAAYAAQCALRKYVHSDAFAVASAIPYRANR